MCSNQGNQFLRNQSTDDSAQYVIYIYFMNMIIYDIFYVFMHKSNFSRFRHKGVDIVHTLVEMRKITLVQVFYTYRPLVLQFITFCYSFNNRYYFFRRNFFSMKKENKSKQSFITAKEFKSNYMPPETTTLSK